jgi:hypothetical protein
MMNNSEHQLSIDEWYKDIQIKGHSLSEIPDEEKTLEQCFVAVHYWGAALKHVPEKFKTMEMCLMAVKNNVPVDEGCSALALVPDKLKTEELCWEAIRHDYLESVYWECGHSVEWDYAATINFIPEKLKTPKLCWEALLHYPSSHPGYINFVSNEFDHGTFAGAFVQPKSFNDIMESEKLFLEALKRVGMPDEYVSEALELRKNKQFKVS